MPIIKSAKKALRQSIKRKAVNDRRTKAMRDAIKKVERSVKEKKADEACRKENCRGVGSVGDHEEDPKRRDH